MINQITQTISLLQTVVAPITDYVTNLDWAYIISFILLASWVNQSQVKCHLSRVFKFKLRTRYRTLLIGLVYAFLVFIIRGGDSAQIEGLLTSLIFAMIFYKMILDQLIHFFSSGNKMLQQKEQKDDQADEAQE